MVCMEGGNMRRCHQDQLRSRFTVELNQEKSEEDKIASGAITTQNREDENFDVSVSEGGGESQQQVTPQDDPPSSPPPSTVTQKQVRKPPDRYEPTFN